MTTSLSSTIPHHHRSLILATSLFLLLISTAASASEAHNSMVYVGRRQNSCHRISAHLPPAIRFHLQQVRHCPSFPPPPPQGDEIDPRYGVEKRLVPSGPNPLHN